MQPSYRNAGGAWAAGNACAASAWAVAAWLSLAPAASAAVTLVIPGYEVTYPAGKIGGSSSTGEPAAFVPIAPAKDHYLDYEVLFESDWEWVRGGKLPGLVGGSHTSGCKAIVPDGWSARFMWRGGGQGQVYLYHQNRKNACGDEYDFPNPGGTFAQGKWNRITEHVVINTPGQKDGLIEAWLNGEKKSNLTGLELRGKVADDVALVDAVSLQTFYGGSSLAWAPSHATHARYSALYVRDDLPDFSQPFDTSGASAAARPVPNPGAALRPGESRALGYLGGSGMPLPGGNPQGTLRLFDARGRLLRSLAAGPGARWDGRDASGRTVPPGLLLVRYEGPAPR